MIVHCADLNHLDIKHWHDSFDRLHASHQAIVYLVSISASGLSLDALESCLKLGKIKDPKNNPFNDLSLLSTCKSLFEQGFIGSQSQYPQQPAIGPYMVHATRKAKDLGLLQKLNQIIDKVDGSQGLGPFANTGENQKRRTLWRSMWQDSQEQVLAYLEKYPSTCGNTGYYPTPDAPRPHPFAEWFGGLFDQHELSQWPTPVQTIIYREILNHTLASFQLNPFIYKAMLSFTEANPDPQNWAMLQECQILMSEFAAPSQTAHLHAALVASLRNHPGEALPLYRDALAELRLAHPKACFRFTPSCYYLAELINDGSERALKEVAAYLEAFESNHPHESLFIHVWETVLDNQNQTTVSDMRLYIEPDAIKTHHSLLLYCLSEVWLGGQPIVAFTQRLTDLLHRANSGHLPLLAAEIALILKQSHSSHQDLETRLLLESICKQAESKRILRLLAETVKPEPDWSKRLRSLAQFRPYQNLEPKQNQVTAPNTRRLVWFVLLEGRKQIFNIRPYEQSLRANGSWTQGRELNLNRVERNPREYQYLTAQDKQACERLNIKPPRTGSIKPTQVDNCSTALLLIGHPYLFLKKDPNQRVTLQKGQPQIHIKRLPDHFQASFSPANAPDAVAVREISPNHFAIFQLSIDHQRISRIFERPVQVPFQEQARLEEVIENLADLLAIHSDFHADSDINEEIASSQIYATLISHDAGLHLTLAVKPFGPESEPIPPGQGGAVLYHLRNGERFGVSRDLQKEIDTANTIVNACSSLPEQEDPWRWELGSQKEILQVLAQLQNLKDQVKVEWPHSRPIQISPAVDASHTKLAVRKAAFGFELTGEIRIANQVVDFGNLLRRLVHSEPPFIEINPHFFLLLSDPYLSALEKIQKTCGSSPTGIYIHPAAILQFTDLEKRVGKIKPNKAWQEMIHRIESSLEIHIKPPPKLKAELRDYQIEGYRWLTRLAYWGVGACLADDMGLGKTIQCLAIMLNKAASGPSLVVCPVSVATNWQEEARRFAPDLNAIILRGRDRSRVFPDLKAYDLVICSYAILQSDIDQLSRIDWTVSVLDEAQAIKNYRTKRARASQRLKAEFRIITTGTPIENNLGDLWSLFEFINPGFLGVFRAFNQRFANPIEKRADKASINQLKNLVRPFILRRLKSQVLKELPPKTEIILRVNRSAEEQELYQSLRQEALVQLDHDSPVTDVLAQITRLRMACCHPSLIDSNLPSSKLSMLMELLNDLILSRHKVLVFSQFVSFLKLIRREIQRLGISHQYLDGVTPVTKRDAAIKAFQAGVGNVFLISLKAGGVGLNLTQADYVIHMDPWWNPAVENQASDRAHRIGQTRPVTVYRLITAGSIEEKILQLNQDKKELAEDLLAASENTGKMKQTELLQLIKAGSE